jgi:DNA-binding transcriptional ArsR family regulator
MQKPRLIWDCGTAYDMFMSLQTLHEPAKYGLRAAWAKGVRARLPEAERKILKQATALLWPFHWIHGLPAPKDGATMLQALEQLPPAERLPVLALAPDTSPDWAKVVQGVAARRAWDEKDLEALSRIVCECKKMASSKNKLTQILKWWSRPQDFGERYLEALRAYQEVFFAEEEARILPALQQALAQAQDLAQKLPLPDLLEELSQGVRLATPPQLPELALVPSFWSTPLILYVQVSAERELFLFGARPPDASLVPGEIVPDALLQALKALGEPTRLRILRYLAAEPLTPSQLARRLRLRAPTVVHHLHVLRLARLVHLTLDKKDKARYAARPEAVKTTCATLQAFLAGDQSPHTSE